jgi:hypothetical protein
MRRNHRLPRAREEGLERAKNPAIEEIDQGLTLAAVIWSPPHQATAARLVALGKAETDDVMG